MALLILNTISILEIFYVFYILKKKWVDVKHDFVHGWNLLKEELSFKKK